jgi:type IV pilus assembly protein PilF
MKLFFSLVLWINLLLVSSCAQQIQDQADADALAAKQKKVSELNTEMGINYLEEKNFVLAKEKLLIALQKDPSSVPANSGMAYYYELTGNIKNAEEYYQKALRLADIKGGVQNNYAVFLCRQKRYKEADKYFQLAINDPKYINTAKAYENAALCAELIPDMAKAIVSFDKALENDPNLTVSMFHLAKIYTSQGEYQKAYNYIKTELLLERRPSQEVLSLALELAKKTGDGQGVILYKSKLDKKMSK